jgi:hypothetical protein
LLDTLKTNTYHDSLALIAYNSSFTDSTIHNLRFAVYAPLVDPQLFIDGNKISANDSTTYKNSINAARTVTPSFNLTLDAQGTTTSGSITFKIVNVDSLLDPDSVYAFVAVCQDSVDGILLDFNYVCRYLYYFPVSVVFPDSVDTTITFANTYPVEYLHAVAFIQNLKNSSAQHLKVYQAATVPFTSVQQ